MKAVGSRYASFNKSVSVCIKCMGDNSRKSQGAGMHHLISLLVFV